jgi:hypothetical protein
MITRRSIPALACAIATLSVANAQTTFTNSTSISVTGSFPTVIKATNGYPSTITVPNTVTGTITNIAVRLNGFNADGNVGTGTQGLGLLLVHSDTGKNLEIMGAPSDGFESFSNVTFYISDTAVSGLSFVNTPFGPMPGGGMPCNSGSNDGGLPWTPPGENGTSTGVTMDYQPSSYFIGTAATTYPPNAPSSINRSGPCSPNSGTLMNTFGNDAPSGTWQLYVDEGENDIISITGGWSLIITVSTTASGTTTSLTSSQNPSFTSSPNDSVTLTATISSTGGTPTGNVAFTDGGGTIAGCGSVPLSSGIAHCITTFSSEGFHDLTATYGGGSGFIGSNGSVKQFVENHATSGGTNQFCNSGPIAVGSANFSGTDTQPYPSVINVSGVSGTVSTVSLVLKNFSIPTDNTGALSNMSMLLVSPDGLHALDFFDDIGGGVGTPTTTLTFSDSGAVMPQGTGGLASPTASYQPTSYRSSSSFAATPAPAPQVPASFRIAAPDGSAPNTFLETFNGATASGPWSLFLFYQASPNVANISGGWCITLTPATGTSTTTTVTGTPNGPAPGGAATGSPVTVTATVKSGGTPVTSGQVTFTENGVAVAGGPTGAVAIGSGGTASFTTSSLVQGDHTILATYTDGSSFNDSFSTYVQRVDNVPTVVDNAGTVSYCNAGPVAFPVGVLGPSFPNPSNINVANLFGTINTVTISLNGYHESASASFLDSVLIGPSGTTPEALDFFSGAGGGSGDGPFNLIFADTGSGLVPTSAFAGGTYKPTSYNTTDNYTASSSGFYTLPSTYNYSSSAGTSTLTNVYGGKDPNGNWDLYFNVTGDSGGGALNTGWCLNFTENAVTGTGTTAHIGPAPGNDMVQGGTGSVTFSLLNNGDASGHGPTGDPDGTVAHAMTVTGTLPSGLTFGTLPSGSPWSCGAAGQLLTCTSMVPIAAGSTYTLLTIPVNVSASAPSSITVSGFTFGGAGMTAGTFSSDTITVNATPFLSITKSPGGTFTQGQTATWNLTVSNTIPNSATSGTVTVVDTLPTGYSLSSFTGTGWGCGAVTVTVTCSSTTAVAGGSSYPVLGLTVNVPANSPKSVTNNAVTFGGGSPTQTTSGNGATAFSTVTVTQVPATVNLTAGNNQSVAINTAFPINFSVTVLDAGGVAINGATVTFTAPGSGASGTFAGGTNVKTATTNSSGVATATVYTSNSTVGGPYNVGVAAGTATNNFSATNLAGPPSSMTANGGTTPQSATINTAFANALAVTVKDAGNNPISGISVTFTAPGSGASGKFSNNTATIAVVTNASGVASAPFTANGTAGGPYTVTAAATGLTTVNFSLTNTAGTPSSMTANAGTTPQSATINTAFANALAVTVKDAGSNPLSGINVTFTAPGSGASGTFSNSTATITVATNASGIASAPFTANGTAGGPYTVTAAATGLTTVNFSLTNTAGTPASMTANAGTTPQSATINTAFTNALAVTVKDAGSNPLSGVNVTFTAPGSGASGIFSNSTATITVATNASGIASAPFTANGTAGGPYTVTAAATGVTTVNFSLTNTAGAAASMTANAGTTPQSAAINTAFTNALAVTVKDAGSNPLSGINVTFTAPGAGASGKFSNNTTTITVATNASGVASAPFTANGTAGGPYTVTAAATGLATVNFSLTNTAGTPASMTANAGTTPQSATINTAFTNALAVTVKDAGSNPLSGINVTFTAPGSGASGIFSNSTATITVTTNASGIASAPFTANGTAGGPYTVTAAATGLTTVNFSLTNTAGTPASMTANAGTTPQSAAINTAFANALAVTVKDAGSNPLSGVNVTFTAPGSGASGLFSNSTTTITVATNASGVASAPFTANGTAGPYNVTATSSGLTAVNFLLTNTGSAAVVTNVSSTTANGTYGVGATIPITVTFNKAVNVIGTPLLALNSGGTAAYTSGSGTSTLTFAYTVAAGQSSAHLDYTSTAALTLNGGSITDSSSIPAMLGLPAPGAAGSLGANKNLVIDTVSPTVVAYNVLWGGESFNVIGSARNRLPWQITGIQVVFSKPIAAGTVNSLSGVTTTGFSGLGTTTLTWTVSPLALGNFATMLAGSGPNALTDAGGNALTGGAGFSQNLKILYGDFNDDGVVNSQDLGAVQAAINQPYNIFADLNGDGAVTILDYTIVRSRLGTSLP